MLYHLLLHVIGGLLACEADPVLSCSADHWLVCQEPGLVIRQEVAYPHSGVIRPRPPKQLELANHWGDSSLLPFKEVSVNDVVDTYINNAWWPGRIKKFLPKQILVCIAD